MPYMECEGITSRSQSRASDGDQSGASGTNHCRVAPMKTRGSLITSFHFNTEQPCAEAIWLQSRV